MERVTPNRALLVGAFLATYLLWGSAYIAVRFTVETIPPFLGAGARFFLSGVILWVWARASGARGVTAKHWVGVLPIALLMFLINNGAVSWAADGRLPSGLISVLVTTVPIWMVVINWLRPGGERSQPCWVFCGLAAGF
ncbi:MAG: EamA family transporter, partial [Blastochloris sp.]|nr:EamA family transporter [Blastochloris sp.]